MPVLAHDDAEPAGLSAQPPSPVASTGTVASLPDGLTFDELPVLAPVDKQVASTGKRSPGWRVERFGPKAPDGKGRYWQWRRGSGKEREATYGGKIQNDTSEYWQHRNTNPHGHDPRRD